MLKSAILACLCLAGPASAAPNPPFVVRLGALECEFTKSHLDVVKWRDRFVIGDPHSDARPTVQLLLLKQGWKPLAAPTDDGAAEPVVEQHADHVIVKLEGIMSEVEQGSGRWEWAQTWRLDDTGLLSLDYKLEQTATPTEAWWLHRIALIGNRTELFVGLPNQDHHTPGKPIPIHTRDGNQVAPLFGEEGSIVDGPRAVHLPYAGHEVILRPDEQARSVELWNGWWRQHINFELPAAPNVETHFEIDLSGLPQIDAPRFQVAPLPREDEPWLAAAIPDLPPVERPIRFAQNTPTIIAWDDVRGHDEEELERFFAEMAKHFDVMELMVGWTDWKWDLGWDTNEAARKHVETIALEVKKQVCVAHKHGVKIALSLNFGGSGPGTGKIETRRQQRFQAETLDPETGEFTKVPDVYDWASPDATAEARKAYEACARLVGPVDYLFFNEPHGRLLTWYQAPLFSEAALADFRDFTAAPEARFPAKPYCVDTPRTDSHATYEDWIRWYDWAQDRFARSIRVQAEAFAAANTGNPSYGGAIYFQNVQWTGPMWAVDLDRIAAIPEVTWLCAEYVTRADNSEWRKFKYFATRHDVGLSSFVNIGRYDPDKPGFVRFEGDDASFERAVRMGIDENAPMISLFPAMVLDAQAGGHHENRTAVWDRATRP